MSRPLLHSLDVRLVVAVLAGEAGGQIDAELDARRAEMPEVALASGHPARFVSDDRRAQIKHDMLEACLLHALELRQRLHVLVARNLGGRL